MKIINPIVFLACLLPVANLASATVSESPCPALLEKLSSKSAMQALGGVVIRLQEYYGDGFGDFMNAHALAKQLKAKFSDLEVSIVIDDKHAYKNIKYRFNNFNPKVAVNKIDGIDVYYSETKQGRDFLNTKQFQIIRVPSGNALNFGNIGKLKYNVYLEEPGAPEGSFKLMWRKYPRNKVIKDKNGNLHLRINPGFSLKSFGVNIPDLTHIEALPKPALLEMLREQTKLNLSKHSDIAHAQWGFAYYHKYNSSRGKEYYRALYESLKKRGAQTPVYIFDFSHVDEITDLKRIITKYLKIHLEYKDLHLGFNHIFPDGTFIPTKYNSQKAHIQLYMWGQLTINSSYILCG
ncbi:MAG: hypothetical protein IPM57_07775 [Oligoflexia bacterium]|nr:hypothetical protein [Oligoflexia bacterium]